GPSVRREQHVRRPARIEHGTRPGFIPGAVHDEGADLERTRGPRVPGCRPAPLRGLCGDGSPAIPAFDLVRKGQRLTIRVVVANLPAHRGQAGTPPVAMQ